MQLCCCINDFSYSFSVTKCHADQYLSTATSFVYLLSRKMQTQDFPLSLLATQFDLGAKLAHYHKLGDCWEGLIA